MKIKTTTKTVEFPGVGEARTTYKAVKRAEAVKVTRSRDAADYLRPFYDEFIDTREEFRIIYLTRQNHIIASECISTGSAIATVVSLQMIARTAILLNAQGVILSHNHPSGITTPSDADRKLTRKAIDGLKLLDINVVDHLILTHNNYLSFADEGIM